MQDCLRMLDGEGSYAHYRHPGSLSEQPALDMQIYDIIRSKWNECRNREMEQKWHKTKSQ